MPAVCNCAQDMACPVRFPPHAFALYRPHSYRRTVLSCEMFNVQAQLAVMLLLLAALGDAAPAATGCRELGFTETLVCSKCDR